MPAHDATYRMRLATAVDAAIIARHRALMFRDMGDITAAAVPTLEQASHAYLTEALARDEYFGWLVETGEQIVAGGGAVLRPLLPRPGHLHGGIEAYVLNVYTEPEHRRHGLARQLMHVILDWCRARGVARVTLHASDEGRQLYVDLGFTATNEMRLSLLR